MGRIRFRAARAYLKSAAISAMLLQIAALVCIAFFGIQPATFEKPWFRWGAAGTILAPVALVRIAARMASACMMAGRSGGIDAPAGGVAGGTGASLMQFLCRIDNCFSTDINDG
ncbi:hypothetical protein [Paraburkholderia strydomiana]|uniref:hypothetical protein n=1 Tax=Paraburkholderia strydomiana TaxID=1245417 RepID=UPI0038B88172